MVQIKYKIKRVLKYLQWKYILIKKNNNNKYKLQFNLNK